MTIINNDPHGKQILDRWATIIVRKNAVYIRDGEAGVNQKLNEFYDPKKYNDDIVLWIPPKDCLRIEFEDVPEKNRRYLAEVESNLKSLGFDYCITAHEGCKSPYINIFNIKDMPLGEDNKLSKDLLLHKIIPKEALGYLDKTNLGWTLSPVIHHPHWKPKYNGAIHKIIRGKDPLEHQNIYPKDLLKKIETSKKRYEQMATKKPMSETWTDDFLINYCTKNVLPTGNRHFIIEKNLAALTVHRKDRDQIVERYLIQQNRKTNTLRTWFNSIVSTNQYTQVNSDELASYIKTNNISYTIKTPIPGIDITPENIPKSRDELYKRIQKWLYIPDTKRIDVLLSVAISTNREGKPLWVFFVGGSGDAKSELIKPLEKLPFARKIDQLTANTLASGKKDVHDLGSELQGKKTLLLFSDLACLTSLNKDEKKKIWGQFRTLYDGEIFKDTGSGVQKKYDNCHVNILACTTSSIKEEYHIHQQLGTRELLFDTDADPRDNKEKMKQALNNNGKQQVMRKEITEAMLGFLQDKVFNDEVIIPDDVQEYLYEQCERMRVLRATGSTDWKTGELNDNIEAEVTTRLIQQFGILYQSLISMDTEYPIERFHDIIEQIVKSSSHPTRYLLYNYFKKYSSDWVTAHDLHIELKISRLTLTSQCEVLWNFNLLKKKFQQEQIGYEGSNRWRDVAYYQANFNQQEKL